MLDILGKRYLFFAISLLVIVPGLIILAINGLPLAIDFKGGSILELRFPSGNLPDTESVVNLYTELGFKEVQVQTALSPNGQRDLLVIRSPFIDDETKIKIVQTMQERFNAPDIVVNRFDSVGPVIAQQVTERAALAVAVAAWLWSCILPMRSAASPMLFAMGYVRSSPCFTTSWLFSAWLESGASSSVGKWTRFS